MKLKQWAPCFYPRSGLSQLKAQWEAFGKEADNHGMRPTPFPLRGTAEANA